MKIRCCLLFCLVLFCGNIIAASILLNKSDATVWLAKQTITGQLTGFQASTVTIFHNDSSFNIAPSSDGRFVFTLDLVKSINTIQARALNGSVTITSSILSLTLPYAPLPVLHAQSAIEGGRIKLYSTVIENGKRNGLTYEWKPSPYNPSVVSIDNAGDSVSFASLPTKDGEYYFTLYARTSEGVDSFKTYVSISNGVAKPFDVKTDRAAWIRNAVIYQVTPYIFTSKGKYADIEKKLPEIATLGINTLYLQPVFKSDKGGQGYDIIDYFALRDDLGTEEELRSLINKAKSMNMRVLFDMVPNHTSINHPYAKDKIQHGVNSHYYNYYQTDYDAAMYSMHYHKHPQQFVYYFWTELVNLNYDNEEVQRWMIEASKYWVRKFDIDGYRFDAVWGVNARKPSFGERLQKELKSLKPDLLLIAEDKAGAGNAYRQGFDAAYDWDKNDEWISKWSWQYSFDEENRQTIFNHPSIAERKNLISKALFSDGDTIGLRLRYLENNDMHRFITNHPRTVTRMAATLLFTLPGLPMMYNGQETGFTQFPYGSGPIYSREGNIRGKDPALFDFYKQLAELRLTNKVFTEGTMTEIAMNNAPGVIAFHRTVDSIDVVVIVNMSMSRVHPSLMFSAGGQIPQNGYQFTNMLTGDSVVAKRAGNGIVIPVEAHSTMVLKLNRNVVVPSVNGKKVSIVPNPADGNFIVNYEMENAGELRISVSDIQGRILTRMQRNLPAGKASIPVNLKGIFSGTCYVKTDDGKNVRSAGVIVVNN